jgi:hypothetical protein
LAPDTVNVKPEGLHEGVVFDDVVEDDSEVIDGARIENDIPVEVPPPGPWVNTSTVAVPVARKSVAGIVAVSCVGLTYEVVSVDFTLPGLTHCTTEHGRRFVPVTVSVTAELPAAAEVCDSALIDGAASTDAGVEIVNGNAADVPTEFVTVTVTATGVAKATCAGGIEAVNCVALTKVVACAVPFQFTIASLVKFVPSTVRVKPCALQNGVDAAEVVDAESELMAGGVPDGDPIVKRTTLEISVVVVLFTFEVAEVAEPGICTATWTVPAVVTSEAGTGAVS